MMKLIAGFKLSLTVLLSLIGASFASAAGVAPVAAPTVFPSPNEIVAAAPAGDWVAIAASDLLVMDLAVDAKGRGRRVVIQLMPAPFSQGWIGNIRKLAAAHWWDGTSVNRVQDNYVVQWGDVTEKKALPVGLVTVGEGEYETSVFDAMSRKFTQFDPWSPPISNQPVRDNPLETKTSRQPATIDEMADLLDGKISSLGSGIANLRLGDGYAPVTGFMSGFPLAESIPVGKAEPTFWPVHCYAMVGVGRNLSPDTGSGAELYTVIGHAPRHLDRNIALVGRVIEGIEHLSSLPRGTEALGFYKTAEERVAIVSTRMGSEVTGLPRYEYLSTESASFAKYADARANRRDPFFIRPAGGADICNIPVPVRRVR
jgi:cyclophilin family peptidyl-prolyl cis-trans isomerase